MSIIFESVGPVFALVVLGYVLARPGTLHLRTLADLGILVASPALVFGALARTSLDPRSVGVLAGGTLWIAAGTALLALAYVRFGRNVPRGLILPAVFWNGGNMALPTARLAFGEPGLEAAAIVFVLLALLSSSLGIWIAKGEGGWREMLRLPLLYASVAGLALAATGTRLPQTVMEPVEMLGAMAIPLMLLNLGMQLYTLRIEELHHSLVAVVIRMLGGFCLAGLFVWAFDVDGVERQVLMLESVMPAAVINILYAQRYDTSPGLIASSIVLGTCLCFLAIPAVLLLVT